MNDANKAEALRQIHNNKNTCVLTTSDYTVVSKGNKHRINNHKHEHLTMHSFEYAAINADVPDALIDGACLTNVLPCITCLRTLAFIKIKEIIYTEDKNKLLNDEYTDICKVLRIELHHINKKQLQTIIDTTPKPRNNKRKQ